MQLSEVSVSWREYCVNSVNLIKNSYVAAAELYGAILAHGYPVLRNAIVAVFSLLQL